MLVMDRIGGHVNRANQFFINFWSGIKFNPGTDINNATGIDYVNFDYHYVIDGNSDAYISLPLFGFNKDISPADFTLAKYELSGWEKITASATTTHGGGTLFTTNDFVRGLVDDSYFSNEFTVGSVNLPVGGDPYVISNGSLNNFYAC